MTKKQNTYITFGSGHSHLVNGKWFDKDCVAVIENVTPKEGREKAFEYFGSDFCFEYPEKHFPFETLKKFYPRGLIKIKNISS